MPFEQIVEMYTPMVKKQLTRLKIYQNHDEFIQVGLIGLWEAYTKFDPTKGEFSTFAFSSVRGRMLSHLSKESRFQKFHVNQSDELLEVVAGNTDLLPFELETIAPYLNGLSDREKLWVNEAILHGKKRKEIAQEQNVSINTVKMWRLHALKKMKQNALILLNM